MLKPIFALVISCAFLTACGSSKQVSNDPNLLPSGVMEPVSGSGASQDSYSWPSDIKATQMPATMK